MDALVTPAVMALVPVTIGLVAVVKMSGYIADRFLPSLSIIFGVALVFLSPWTSINASVLSGVVVGLLASGLYSGGRATVSG